MRPQGVGLGVRGQAVSLVIIPVTAQRSNDPSLAVLSSQRENVPVHKAKELGHKTSSPVPNTTEGQGS